MYVRESSIGHKRPQLRPYARVLSHLKHLLAVPIPPSAQKWSISATIRLEYRVEFDHLKPTIRLQQGVQLAHVRLPTIGVDPVCKHATVDEVESFRSQSVTAGILSERDVQIPPLSDEGFDPVLIVLFVPILIIVGVTLPSEDIDSCNHSFRPKSQQLVDPCSFTVSTIEDFSFVVQPVFFLKCRWQDYAIEAASKKFLQHLVDFVETLLLFLQKLARARPKYQLHWQ